MPIQDFDKNLIKDGFTVRLASEFNVQIAEKGEIRPNVIQVSFKNKSILWDIAENKEVLFIERLD